MVPGMLDLTGFALAVLLIELTPGPNMAWLVGLTLSEGRRSGMAAILGVALGLAANAGLSVLGASYLLTQSGAARSAVSVMGAAMMLYLAWTAWHQAGESSPGAMPMGATKRNLTAGFTINLLNPKAALFFITVMPQFVTGGQPTYAQGMTMAVISVAVATAIHLGLVLGAGKLRHLLLVENRARAVRRMLAMAMVGVAVWFLAKAFA